jgi:ribosomal protein S18 acetylase RimI-like enzyme
MQFELSEALLDDILFSMEDQEGEFFVDCQEGVVALLDEIRDELEEDEENRFISLPDWDSSDGFRLMERFAAGFRNPLVRNELSAALNQGKGVFRAFKNVLSKYPATEKLWYSYKEREMKREIIRWYNALREEWGLEKIGFEPEETEDLVLEDFRFRELNDDDREAAAALHRLCLEGVPKNNLSNGTDAEETPALALIAESGNGEFAGYISAGRAGKNLFIHTLEVKPEYRGLGIGKSLLSHLLEKLEPSKVHHVFFELPIEWEGFSRALIREGFEPRVTRYCLKVKER